MGAEDAFFSTCGSSLSVKAPILAVTRGQGELLIDRDAQKSVVSGLVLSGLQPRRISCIADHVDDRGSRRSKFSAAPAAW